jgi:hypothetical protein
MTAKYSDRGLTGRRILSGEIAESETIELPGGARENLARTPAERSAAR